MQEVESTSTFFSPCGVFPHTKGKTHSAKSLPRVKQGVCTGKCHRAGVYFHRMVLKKKTGSRLLFLFFFMECKEAKSILGFDFFLRFLSIY